MIDLDEPKQLFSNILGTNMKTVNLYQFYSIGTVLHPLSTIEDGRVIKDVYYELLRAQNCLQSLSNDNLVPIIVCKPTVWKILNAINAIIEAPEGQEVDFDRKLDFMEAYNIRNGISEFETVFSAELQTLASYFVSQKLIYSTSDLIERPENLFPEKIRSLLPEQCINDIKQAGKCIAFDIPTGAAFHILRATETIIRLYYSHIVGSPPKSKMRNWGTYIRNLNSMGADVKITGFLDHIREQYRNPILHPEEMLSSDDAVILLGTSVSAIVQMILAIGDKPPKQDQLTPNLNILNAIPLQ